MQIMFKKVRKILPGSHFFKLKCLKRPSWMSSEKLARISIIMHILNRYFFLPSFHNNPVGETQLC